MFFVVVKRVPGWGLKRIQPNEAILCPLIIIILISYYYILLLNYKIIINGEPSQPKPKTELSIKIVLLLS